jgi:hypothetical protein
MGWQIWYWVGREADATGRVGLTVMHAIAKRPEGSDITLSKKWLLRL